MSAYQASKATVMRLTESLSEEVKGAGVNVNAVLPSVIDTSGNRAAMPDADFATWVTPTDLGEVICFLDPMLRGQYALWCPLRAYVSAPSNKPLVWLVTPAVLVSAVLSPLLV